MTDQIEDWRRLPDEYWRQHLTHEQYQVLRQRGTEPPGSSKCEVSTTDSGSFGCAGCSIPLFQMGKKFESGSGWPSFYEPIEAERLELSEDKSHGMTRVEVSCKRCGGHLGHVFPDGPPPTGLRYCINGVALRFLSNS